MATTAGSLLGNYAPAMQEPYAIESTLANKAVEGNPMAATLMDQYWYERQLREGDYAQRLGEQMQYGKAQLAAQLQDQQLRAIAEGAKTPGVLRMFASSPQYSGMFAGMDPTAVQSASDLAEQQARANVFKSTGQGAQGFAAGGYGIPIPGLEAATGISGITPQMQTAVAAQAEANKGRLGAAAIHAASAGGGGSASVSGPPLEALGGQSIHRSLPKGSANWTDQQITDYLRARSAGGSPQATSPYATDAQPTAPPPVRRSSTVPNLPPAKTDTPANAPNHGAIPPGTQLHGPAVDAAVNAIKKGAPNLKGYTPQQRQDLANPTIKMGTDGRPHIHGGSGADYGPAQ